MTPAPQQNKSVHVTAWKPLAEPLFRALWIAAVISNIGSLMQAVGAAWLMTTLTSSPFMVSLVQTAASLPLFLLALPAGAATDVVDRRWLLLITEWLMLAAAAALGLLTITGATTAWTLLALTFVLAAGAAVNMPPWQAIIPELVPRKELSAAVALNSVGFNIARAVGPALGGIVVAAAGAGIVFLLNAASFLGVIAVLYYWRRPAEKSVLPAERMLGAMRAGLRYVRHTPAMRSVLLKVGIFTLFAIALLTLLPLVSRDELGLSSSGYGLLLGAFGLGAVVGALVLPKARQKIKINALVNGLTLLFAAAMIAVASSRNVIISCVAMVSAGVAWLILLTIFNTSIQLSVPSWVRGRVLAFYLLVLFGGMAGGGMLCGIVAEWAGVTRALLATGIAMAASVALTCRKKLLVEEDKDITPSMHWLTPMAIIEPQPEHGPVLVMVEYLIDPERGEEFAALMQEVGRIRRRDGAFIWNLSRDLAEPGRCVEIFYVESWAEHLRQHERVTIADREVEDRIKALHIGEKPPVVSHLISAYTVFTDR